MAFKDGGESGVDRAAEILPRQIRLTMQSPGSEPRD